MLKIIPYDRFAGVSYAHRWAYERNPKYMNFDELGGDCTNFASQCLYAGAGVMNFTPTFGWYYNSGKDTRSIWERGPAGAGGTGRFYPASFLRTSGI